MSKYMSNKALLNAMAPVTPGKRSYRLDITPEIFVKTWAQSQTSEEVAQKLNWTKIKVNQRAASYRKKGIKLDKYARSRFVTAMDVDALNRIYALAKKGAKK